MESVGLAVGIAGLAGLFSACLDVAESARSYRDFGWDSTVQDTQFQTEVLRFKKWGRAIGLDSKDKLSGSHHPALDDAEVFSNVHDVLFILQRMRSANDERPRRPLRASLGISHNRGLPSASRSESKREKIAWALWRRSDGAGKLEQFRGLVQQLHDLVPLNETSKSNNDDVLSISLDKQMSLHDQAEIPAWLEELLNTFKDIRVDMRREVMAWLHGDSKPNDHYEISAHKRIDGTCDWILERRLFQSWSSPNFSANDPKLLWINGPAGFGKTILCARVVEFLKATLESPVAYFFLSSQYESRSDLSAALRSWISQLIRHQDGAAAYTLVCERRNLHEHTIATYADVAAIFHAVVHTVPECTLVLDGLDEYSPKSSAEDGSESIRKFVAMIKESIAGTRTRVMIVSRDEPDIRFALITDESFGTFSEHKVSVRDVRRDTSLYSRSIVRQKLQNKDNDVREDVSLKMSSRCEGQFLWLKMQEPFLRRYMNKKQLLEAVEKTPPGLDSVYERNWEKINGLDETERMRAISLLRWAAFAVRPLTVSEITEAMLTADDDDAEEFPVDELPDTYDNEFVEDYILRLCGSLVEVENKPSIPVQYRFVHLAHFSVKQYILSRMPTAKQLLLSDRALQASHEQLEHTMLARLCVRFLNYQRTWKHLQQLVSGPAFRDYAADTWNRHSHMSVANDTVLMRLEGTLLDDQNPSWVKWREWYESTDSTIADLWPHESVPPSPLYYAAILGLTELALNLIDCRKEYVNHRSSNGRTALHASCQSGNLNLVEALLDAGAITEIADFEGYTPVHAAAISGNDAVLNLLAEKGVDLSTTTPQGVTPIYIAASENRIGTVKLLLEKGCDISSATVSGITPLFSACQSGHEEVVEFLLDRGASISEPYGPHGHPLHAACMRGCRNIANMLLERGAATEITDDYDYTPLHMAVIYNHLEVVKLLVSHGADISASKGSVQTPLGIAVSKGRTDMVKLLLIKGAEVDLLNNDKGYALHWACHYGHLETLEAVLESGIDLASRDYHGLTLLHTASTCGRVDMAKLLLRKGADPTLVDDRGRTPLCLSLVESQPVVAELLVRHCVDRGINCSQGDSLHLASMMGFQAIVEMLILNGAEVSGISEEGLTPLMVAAKHGQLEVAKFLLNNGADPSMSAEDGTTPLSLAARQNELELVKYLLDQNAEVSACSYSGVTALHLASTAGNLEMVKALLDHGADVSCGQDFQVLSPLACAASTKNLELVALLIDKGADVSAADVDGRTPVYEAAKAGHLENVRLLLQMGAQANSFVYGLGSATLLEGLEHMDVEMAELLLANDSTPSIADLSIRDVNGRTYLHTSVEQQALGFMRLLLDKGVSPYLLDAQGRTPLHVAADKGHAEAFELLLERDSAVSLPDDYDSTPLHLASTRGHTEIVALLLFNGAEKDCQDVQGRTPVYKATENGHSDIVEMLIENGSDISILDFNGQGLLHAASAGGSIEIAKIFLSMGADAKAASYDSVRPLHRAASEGHVGTCQLLLDSDGGIEAIDNDGLTPLHFAAASGHPKVVSLLLKRGAESSARNFSGETALHMSSKKGSFEVAELLVDHGIDVSALTHTGRSACHYACFFGHAGTVKLLLRFPGLLDVQDNDERSPLFHAAWAGETEVLSLLLNSGHGGRWLNARDRYGSTPIFAAVRNGHISSVDVLLHANKFLPAEEALQMDTVDGFGKTLIWWARCRGKGTVTELLLSYARRRKSTIDDFTSLSFAGFPEFNAHLPCCSTCTLAMSDTASCAFCSGAALSGDENQV